MLNFKLNDYTKIIMWKLWTMKNVVKKVNIKI